MNSAGEGIMSWEFRYLKPPLPRPLAKTREILHLRVFLAGGLGSGGWMVGWDGMEVLVWFWIL